MTFVEMNKQILRGSKEECSYPVVSLSEINKLHDILSINAKLKDAFDATEDGNYFFKTFPEIGKMLDKHVLIDVFYAYKMGKYYHGVPNKLIFILRKAFEAYGTKHVNKALESCTALLKPYIGCIYKSSEGDYTIKDIIDNLCGYSTTLLTDANLKCDVGDNLYEVYISNVDRVAIIPRDIAERLSYEDCLNLEYSPELGIHLKGTPLRTIGGRFGVLFDDFDLSEVF